MTNTDRDSEGTVDDGSRQLRISSARQELYGYSASLVVYGIALGVYIEIYRDYAVCVLAAALAGLFAKIWWSRLRRALERALKDASSSEGLTRLSVREAIARAVIRSGVLSLPVLIGVALLYDSGARDNLARGMAGVIVAIFVGQGVVLFAAARWLRKWEMANRVAVLRGPERWGWCFKIAPAVTLM